MGYVDDGLDLPLPDDDFPDRIEALLTHDHTHPNVPPAPVARPLPAPTPSRRANTDANAVVHS